MLFMFEEGVAAVLTISGHQMKVFEAVAMERFRAKIGKIIQLTRPDLAGRASPAATASFCDSMIADARTLGFRTEFEVGVFCSVTLIHGLNWHLNPGHPLYAIARCPGVSPFRRASNLRNGLIGPKAWRARRSKLAPCRTPSTGPRHFDPLAP